jgi:hypothetical protein
VSSVIDYYSGVRVEQSTLLKLENIPRPEEYRAKGLLMDARLLTQNKVGGWRLPFGSDIILEIGVKVLEELPTLELGLALKTITGFEIASTLCSNSRKNMPFKAGIYYFRVIYHELTLAPGVYRFGLGLRSERGFEDYLPGAFDLEVIVSETSAENNVHKVLGAVIPKVGFEVSQKPTSSF